MASKPGRMPAIYNLTLTDADTEYEQALPENVTKLEIKCRTNFDMKLSYASEGTYITIPAGIDYWEEEIDFSQSVYLQSAEAGVVAEIKVWSI